MGDKNGGIQKIHQTPVISMPFPHIYLTMINMTGPDEIRLSQLNFFEMEGSDRLKQKRHVSVGEDINLISLLL